MFRGLTSAVAFFALLMGGASAAEVSYGHVDKQHVRWIYDLIFEHGSIVEMRWDYKSKLMAFRSKYPDPFQPLCALSFIEASADDGSGA